MPKKKILFVAMSDSIHTVRWIRQLDSSGYDVFIFPSYDINLFHDGLNGFNICFPFYNVKGFFRFLNLDNVFDFLYRAYKKLAQKINPSYYQFRLFLYIKVLKPDILHSLETQGAGYLVNSVKCNYFKNGKFPTWWHTNWGSDIYLFGRLDNHSSKIVQLLSNIDYYSAECERDISLAKKYGYKGLCMPVYPNTGGFDLLQIMDLRKNSLPTSQRKFIMIKGYQGWAGRALFGLAALRNLGNLLKGFTIIVYSNPEAEDIKISSELISKDLGIAINVLPKSSHNEILYWQSLSRISIGLSISDGISTSMLEAMALGSFPIQSDSSAGDEWIKDKKTGFLVSAEDPFNIADSIKKALLNDKLVDEANEINWNVISERAEFGRLKKLSLESYKNVFNKNS
jgi:hypothetical protein